jgi:hypothetical protein
MIKKKRKSKKAKNNKTKIDLRLYKDLSEDEDYKRRFKEQNGGCAICHRPPRNRKLARDHNHTTGKARGLLCFPCNKFLVGFIERLKIIPEAIVRYLEKYDPESPLLLRKNEDKPKTTTE